MFANLIVGLKLGFRLDRLKLTKDIIQTTINLIVTNRSQMLIKFDTLLE